MITKTFHLGDILSITTGRLVSPSHIDGVYGILNWMTGDNLFTHQLPRTCRECEGPLLAQHPDLADIKVPEFDGEAEVITWLAVQVERFGETRDVAPLHEDEHTHISPLDEIRIVAPHAEVITFEVPGAGDSTTTQED
jgi:hypothetical protein